MPARPETSPASLGDPGLLTCVVEVTAAAVPTTPAGMSVLASRVLTRPLLPPPPGLLALAPGKWSAAGVLLSFTLLAGRRGASGTSSHLHSEPRNPGNSQTIFLSPKH